VEDEDLRNMPRLDLVVEDRLEIVLVAVVAILGE
jgi:hypothetical protein